MTPARASQPSTCEAEGEPHTDPPREAPEISAREWWAAEWEKWRVVSSGGSGAELECSRAVFR